LHGTSDRPDRNRAVQGLQLREESDSVRKKLSEDIGFITYFFSDIMKDMEKTGWPRISIITPSYNQGDFIEQTILSVLSQNYPNLEFIVVDGGSTDNTHQILSKYKDKFDHLIIEKDKGQSDAINKGFRKCTGDIINWLNSDDQLAPNALMRIGQAYMKFQFDWITGANIVQTVDRSYEYLQLQWPKYWHQYMLNFPVFPQDATFFSRRVLEELVGVDEELHQIMDVDFYARMLSLSKKGALCNFVISYMTLHGQQKTILSEYKHEKLQMSQTWIQKLAFRLINTRLNYLVKGVVEQCYSGKARRDFRVVQIDPFTYEVSIAPFSF
jgi:glycosyltransferase involved in cell wall biosynthesis